MYLGYLETLPSAIYTIANSMFPKIMDDVSHCRESHLFFQESHLFLLIHWNDKCLVGNTDNGIESTS